MFKQGRTHWSYNINNLIELAEIISLKQETKSKTFLIYIQMGISRGGGVVL